MRGRAALVSFLVDAVYAGKHVASPYSLRLQPATLACETLVKGRAAVGKGASAKPRHTGRKKRAGRKKKSAAGPIAGALYVGAPFGGSGNNFELRILPHAHGARFVGTFVYTDPGCRTQPFGNEFLTSANAPEIKIGKGGRFSGRTTNGAYVDKISGTFEGKKAPAKFVETIPGCRGDKPQVFAFTMHADVGLRMTPRAVLAATPAAGWFGTCGGDEGPVNGFFTVPSDRKQVQQSSPPLAFRARLKGGGAGHPAAHRVTSRPTSSVGGPAEAIAATRARSTPDGAPARRPTVRPALRHVRARVSDPASRLPATSPLYVQVWAFPSRSCANCDRGGIFHSLIRKKHFRRNALP